MTDSSRPTLALVGPGRAGTAIALGLVGRGWRVVAVAGRSPESESTRRAASRLGAPAVAVAEAGRGAGLVVLAPPDGALVEVATAITPSLVPGALVVHLSGASTLAALAPVARARPDVDVGSLHPLQSLPSDDLAQSRLPGAWCAVDGPPARLEPLARALGMRPFRVEPAARAAYHAAACVASNHLVALLAQVARIAADASVPLEAFLPLARATLDNVEALGPTAALTGPVARGDDETVSAHLAALTGDERATYQVLARAAGRLAGREASVLEGVLE